MTYFYIFALEYNPVTMEFVMSLALVFMLSF